MKYRLAPTENCWHFKPHHQFSNIYLRIYFCYAWQYCDCYLKQRMRAHSHISASVIWLKKFFFFKLLLLKCCSRNFPHPSFEKGPKSPLFTPPETWKLWRIATNRLTYYDKEKYKTFNVWQLPPLEGATKYSDGYCFSLFNHNCYHHQYDYLR